MTNQLLSQSTTGRQAIGFPSRNLTPTNPSDSSSSAAVPPFIALCHFLPHEICQISSDLARSLPLHHQRKRQLVQLISIIEILSPSVSINSGFLRPNQVELSHRLVGNSNEPNPWIHLVAKIFFFLVWGERGAISFSMTEL